MSFNCRVILKVAGLVGVIMGCAMVIPGLVSCYYKEYDLVRAFFFTLIPSILIGTAILKFNIVKSTRLSIRDGYLIVALCWLMAAFLGAIPYLASGITTSFIDAFFESTSGFTTTGISILPDVTTLPKGLLFWRAFSHWLGGMGILVFAISILPALGIGGQRIARAETPGPTVEKISTRMSDSAKVLYIMYIVFTLVAFILLKLGGLGFFDTAVHAFSSMGTGGLSTYTSGVAHFDSVYIETVLTVFSLLASVNFVLYGHLIHGHVKDFFSDAEFRTFLAILASAILLVTFNLYITNTYDTLGTSFRHSFFQTSAFLSTSGFFTADYTVWPAFCQAMLFLLLFIGGCSASTCGSIKVIRIMVLFKLIVRGILKRLHPNAVVPIKIAGKTIAADIISAITNFLLLYFSIFILTAVVVSLDNYDFITSLSASACALSNTGAGMGLVGPGGSFAIFSPFVRLWLSIVMIAGRLELFTIILLFTPSFWNPAKRIKV